MATKPRADDNLLLRHLEPHQARQLSIQDEDHGLRVTLIDAEESPKWVFFPHGKAVASIVRTTSGGQMVEAGVVGFEGVFSIHTPLAGPAPTGSHAVVQNHGRFSRVEAGAVRRLLEESGSFRDAVLRYTSFFLDQVTQNLVCNRLHSIEQRLSKWLLVMSDRAGSNELHLTQELLSHMLGVHRPGVSLAVSALEEEGLIKHKRAWIELANREPVIDRSCECYQTLRDKFGAFVTTNQR